MTSNKNIKINSLLTSLVIAETNVCAILTTFVSLPKISVLLMILICILSIIINRQIKISSSSLIASTLIILLLILSIILNGTEIAGERLIYFIAFGITAMITMSVKQELRLILKFLLSIYTINLCTFFLFRRVSFLESEDFWVSQMGVAYSFLPLIIVSLTFIVFKEKIKNNVNKYNIVHILIFALSVYIILYDCATRGVIISAIVGIYFIIFRKLSRRGKFGFGLILIVFCVILTFNTDAVIIFVLDRLGGDVKAFGKFSQLDIADFSNGRNDLADMAIQMIKENPCIGYGVGYFENITKSVYVHQFFLELLLDCGLFGMILFLIPIIRLIKQTYKEEDNIFYAFKIFLLSCSFLPLFFSFSFWMYPPFWCGYFYAINVRTEKKFFSQILVQKRIS